MTRLTAITYALLVAIVSNFWLERVDAQTTKIKTSWNVTEELHILSNAMANLEAKIEGQAALMNNSLASLEAKIERQAALLNNVIDNVLGRLEATVVGQAASLNNAVSSAVTTLEAKIEALLNNSASNSVAILEAKVEGQAVLLNNAVNNVVASLETRIDGKVVSFNTSVNNAVASLEAKSEEQAAILSNFVSNEEWQQPFPLNTTTRTIVAFKDENVDIWCVVHGTPLPEIKWTKENGKLASDRVELANNGKVLRIKHVQWKDEGTYVCVAMGNCQ